MKEPTFCERLRELRKERRLSQSALAYECRLHPQGISMLERGLRTPAYWSLLEFSRFFGVSLDYLAGLTDRREIA
jgi:transcriptional regulator with XRE-family HTH domain